MSLPSPRLSVLQWLEIAAIHLFYIVAGCEALFSIFFLLGRKPSSPLFVAQLMGVAHNFYSPEREIPVYLLGCLLIPCITLWGAARWFHYYKDEPGYFSRTLLLTTSSLVSIGSYLLALRLKFFSWHYPFSLYDGFGLISHPHRAIYCFVVTTIVIGIQVISVLYGLKILKQQNPIEKSFYWQERIYSQFKNLTPLPTLPSRHPGAYITDTLFALLLFSLVYIPDTVHRLGIIYNSDRFHHYNYFIMAPLLGYSHGNALGTNFYSQYGVGWPILFLFLKPILPLSYSGVLHVFVLTAAIYYIALFFFFRSVGVSSFFAFFSTLGILAVQVQTTAFATPSSTILRAPGDIALFLILGWYLRTRRLRIWLVIAALLAIAILVETDTGIYLTATFLIIVGICAWSDKKEGKIMPFLPTLLWGGTVFLVVLLTGLWIASRGTLATGMFWKGWLESAIFYPSGMGMILIRPTLAVAGKALAVVAIQYMALCLSLERIRRSPGNRKDILRAAIAIYGMFYLLYFLGRSHPLNLMHCLIPCMILISWPIGRVLSREWIKTNLIVRTLIGITLVLGALWKINSLPQMDDRFNLFHSLLVSLKKRIYPSTITTETTIEIPLLMTPTGAPDVIPLPADAAHTAAFRAATEEIVKWQARGKRVMVLSTEDTTLYFASGAAPLGRYSPILPLLLTQSDVRRLQARIATPGTADVILLLTAAAATKTVPIVDDVIPPLRKTIAEHYHYQRIVGDYEVYLSTSPSSVL